ncbi:MAG: DUF547 domain-containing protein [Aureispira sp.]|nr:DUF547 domain-containing protein [Aureispira sp.]
MKNSVIIIRLCLLSVLPFFAFQWIYAQDISNSSEFFSKTNVFFESHVQESSIKYTKIKKDTKPLLDLIHFIETTPLDELPEGDRKAYLINTYNLLIIKAVLDHFPTLSTQDIDGFFSKESHLVGGEHITLDRLEKEILLKKYPDSRLHFALVCAAKGCPPIANFAYTPTNLDTQLEQQTKKAINSSNFLFMEEVSNTAYLSPIFQWYTDDFSPNVFTFINQYKSTPLPEGCLIKHYEYDWKLNAWELEIVEDLIITRY